MSTKITLANHGKITDFTPWLSGMHKKSVNFNKFFLVVAFWYPILQEKYKYQRITPQ